MANGMAESQVHGQANGIESDYNPGGMDSAKDSFDLAGTRCVIAVRV